MRFFARNPVFRNLQKLGLLAIVPAAVVLTLHAGILAYHGVRYAWLDMRITGAFPIDEDRGGLVDIPDSVRRLDGQRVSIEGWMIPLDQTEPFTEFVLTPQFGEHIVPHVQQEVLVTMPRGRSTPYIPGRLRVEGRIHVGVERDDGYVVDIFRMESPALLPVWSAAWDRWPFVVTGIAAPMLALLWGIDALLASQLRLMGHCRDCGYDLRATPDRCPECGVVPTKV